MDLKQRILVDGYIRCLKRELDEIECTDDSLSKIVNVIYTWYFGKQDIKLLFLDVDGVLNTKYDNGLRDDLIKHLAKIIECTNCKIILSSTWRLKESYKQELFDALKQKGNIDIDNVYIGDTPLISNGFVRALEIKSTLNDISVLHNVVSWCAVDDDDLGNPLLFNNQQWYIKDECKKFMRNHFVKTNENMGLIATKMKQAIRILNGVTK
eukprot:160646_1